LILALFFNLIEIPKRENQRNNSSQYQIYIFIGNICDIILNYSLVNKKPNKFANEIELKNVQHQIYIIQWLNTIRNNKTKFRQDKTK